MSSETPEGPSEDRPTEPFARGRIQWSRPPQPVFHAGPLPQGRSRPQARPAPGVGGGILSGSMIPQARSAPVPEPEPEPEAAPPPLVEDVVVESPPEPVAAATPEAETVAAQPAPEPRPVEPEIVIEAAPPEPEVTEPLPSSGKAKPGTRTRSLPSVVVTPAIYASVGAAMQKVAKNDRGLLAAGVAAVAVIGGFVWLATLPAPQPVDQGPTPMIAETPTLTEEGLTEDAPPAAATAPAPAAVARPTPAPVTARAQAPEPRPTTRPAPVVVTPRSVETAPRPYIETAPLVVEPPTPAAPPPSDPEAPIVTRPQPLD